VVGLAEIGGHVLLTTVYGSRFGGMGPVFTLLCMGVAWYAVGFPAGYTLIARGRNKGLLAGSATAAVVNLSLNAILIPVVGPMGAAAATFLAFLAASLVWLRAHKLLDSHGLRLMAGLTAVTLGGITVLLSPAMQWPIGAATISLAVVTAAVGLRERVFQ